jgi:type VI secretion system protein ImpK
LTNAAAYIMNPTNTATDNLATIFQETLTVIERLRSNRQGIQDAGSFRQGILSGLAAAEQQAVRRGYSGEDVRVATFAIVAFLDESVLNSGLALFADWHRKPLQEELFGVHIAGEIFFRNVDRLLARPDSAQTEELLEVYELCLLLGFRGRYTSDSGVQIRSITTAIGEKRRRVRRVDPVISPHWAPGSETGPAAGDPWIIWLVWAAAASFAFAVVLFVGYKLLLGSGESDLQAILTQHRL